MVSVATKSNKKYPLLFLPDFVEDLVNGVYSRRMMDKYYIHTYNDFYLLTSSILKFDGQRFKSHNENLQEKNLANQSWRQQHDLFTSQFRLFRPQLVNMFNCSMLRALAAHAVLRQQYVSYKNIKKSVLESYDTLKTKFHMPQDAAFEDYIENGFEYKIDSTIARMAQESLLTSIVGDASVPAKYTHMEIWIRNIIENNKDGVQYQSLVTKILREFPLLRLLPGRDEIDGMLDNLERSGSIICKHAFWKFAPYSNLLFSFDSYRSRVEEMRAQLVALGRTKFFGRRITPNQFISELQTLELGDIGDRDDQVTRIAGLVLSDAALLQSPAEHVPGFDFVVDFANYNFRPEHVEMMKRLDFDVRSKTLHCKVMINDEITMYKIDELCSVIPDGEQGVVFTCRSVRPNIRQRARDDRTMQVIDEDGIRAWCSITSTIPCRLNSVARVMYGDSRGKAVAVRSVNYESGMATVEAAPDRREITLPIGCLEEIGPDTVALSDADLGDSARMQNKAVSIEDYFAAASEKYFNFLCDLASLAQNTFENGLVLGAHAVHKTRLDLLRSIKPQMLGRPRPDIDTSHRQFDRYVEFEHGIYSTVNIYPATTDKPFVCECGHKLNEVYRFTLCHHLVSAIIRLGLKEVGDWKSAKDQICMFRQGLRAFRMQNVIRVILALRDVIGSGSEQLLEAYVWSHRTDNDGSGGDDDDNSEENQDAVNDADLSDAEKRIRDSLEGDLEMPGLFETLEVDLSRLDEASLRRVIDALYYS